MNWHRLWRRYCAWLDKFTVGERAIFITVLLILASLWLIYVKG